MKLSKISRTLPTKNSHQNNMSSMNPESCNVNNAASTNNVTDDYDASNNNNVSQDGKVLF